MTWGKVVCGFFCYGGFVKKGGGDAAQKRKEDRDVKGNGAP